MLWFECKVFITGLCAWTLHLQLLALFGEACRTFQKWERADIRPEKDLRVQRRLSFRLKFRSCSAPHNKQMLTLTRRSCSMGAPWLSTVGPCLMTSQASIWHCWVSVVYTTSACSVLGSMFLLIRKQKTSVNGLEQKGWLKD